MIRTSQVSLERQSEQSSQDALNASKIYDQRFSEYLAGHITIADLKPYVVMTQNLDKKMLALQARVREKKIQRIEAIESFENDAAEKRRQTLIRMLEDLVRASNV